MPTKNWESWRPLYDSVGFNILCYAVEFQGQMTLSDIIHQAGIRSPSTAYSILSRLKKASLIKNGVTEGLNGAVPKPSATKIGASYYYKVFRQEHGASLEGP